MNEYYVEKIEHGNSIYTNVYWGVFRREHADSEMLNKLKSNPNLILYTYEKIYAEKIAEMLNVDNYIHENI